MLPPVRIPHPHVFLDERRSPLIEGTRVPVRRIFSWHRQGTTCETLLRRYPQLGPARIFDALAFAYDNLDLVTADLVREREELAQEIAARGRVSTSRDTDTEADARASRDTGTQLSLRHSDSPDDP